MNVGPSRDKRIGFPRSLDRLEAFEGAVGPLAQVVALNCSEETMMKRLRSRGRFDDGVEGIQKRIQTFKTTTKAVIDSLRRDGRVTDVDADGPVEDVRRQMETKVAPLVEHRE